MVTLHDLMTFLNDFIGDVGDKDAYFPNGLQVRGRGEIKLLATGASANPCVFLEAVARNAPGRPTIRHTSLPEGGRV